MSQQPSPAPNLRAQPSPPPPTRPWVAVLLVLTVAWLVPASWVALSPPFSRPLRPAPWTRARLNDLDRALHAFRNKHQVAPMDLATLRAFAKIEGLRFDAYDAFGQRFQYLRLSERQYLLRSFGADGVQNTFSSAPDMGVVRWGKRPDTSPTLKYGGGALASYFPAVTLFGADAPGRSWMAKLFVDVDGGQRTLVVRHRRKNGLFLAAPHDQVEEFVWLPSGEQIVYSATGSARHRDGLFLWNLQTDEVVNLVDVAEKQLPISPAARAGLYFFSLAGVTAPASGRPPVVYAFWGYRSEGPLDPMAFYAKESLIAFAVPEPVPGQAASARFLMSTEMPGLETFQSPLISPMDLGARLDARGGLKVQQDWLKLPLDGDVESVLVAWHNFVDHNGQTPLFPYGLYVLASLYNESYAMLAGTRSRDAEVLRTYGTEIARALVSYPLAPTYLRSLAMHLYESLMEGRAVPMRVARLKAPVEAAQTGGAAPDTAKATRTSGPEVQ